MKPSAIILLALTIAVLLVAAVLLIRVVKTRQPTTAPSSDVAHARCTPERNAGATV